MSWPAHAIDTTAKRGTARGGSVAFVAYGTCHCGCGGPTQLARQTDTADGYVKGQPRPFRVGHRNAGDPATRFWSSVNRQDDGCWQWTGTLHRGYGEFRLKGRQLRAHRFAYEELVGPIPDGLVIDHLCRNRACVNPAHLEPVTDLENRRRGLKNPDKTHCDYGHALTPENVYQYKTTRACRTCIRARDRRRYWEKKGLTA